MNAATAAIRRPGLFAALALIALLPQPLPADEKDDRIRQLETQLAQKDARIQQLELQAKTDKGRINALEEQVAVGTPAPETAEVLPEGTYPWTENMRRLPVGVLFPRSATIPEGRFYARFSHISQNQTFAKGGRGDPFDDLLGLESGVKVALMLGYGILDNWDVTVQRTNGRDYTRNSVNFEQGSFDLWDVMTKVKLLDEQKQWLDLAVAGGTTIFWQDNDSMEFSGNAALLLEKSLWRFRLGSGFLYSSLSDFNMTRSTQPGTALDKTYVRDPTAPHSDSRTLAVPASLSLALTDRSQLFGEMAFPVDGYRTGNGPSEAFGYRYNTHSHAFSVFLCNTSNDSFNSTATGGYKQGNLDVFGFDISVFF
jgi:hypothetical protein